MRGTSSILAALILVLLPVMAPGAVAVQGKPDGAGHPNVGLLVVIDPDNRARTSVCSGTLVAPRVFVTAGHCTARFPHARVGLVTFDTRLTSASPFAPGLMYTHPQFLLPDDVNDLGVVVLRDPVAGVRPAPLPAADLLEQRQRKPDLPDSPFITVGYGAQRQGAATPAEYAFDGVRRAGTARLLDLTALYAVLSAGEADGAGGTCYGDSGGPNFLGGSDMIVGVTSAVRDPTCGGVVYRAYRLDTPAARAFLSSFAQYGVVLP
jgi:hypothetical protein